MNLNFLHRNERLHRLLSGLKCKLGIYYQYQAGVCGWCGEPHVRMSRAHTEQHRHLRSQIKRYQDIQRKQDEELADLLDNLCSAIVDLRRYGYNISYERDEAARTVYRQAKQQVTKLKQPPVNTIGLVHRADESQVIRLGRNPSARNL